MENLLEQKYRTTWETTLSNKMLKPSDIEGSKFYFELNSDKTSKIVNGFPVPKKFDTYAIVCCLPFSESFQNILENHWKKSLELLGNPVSYGVEPQNRHVEIFLFQRPEELFLQKQIKDGIKYSLAMAKKLSSFKITFCYPFITPNGTIVVPGFENNGAIEEFRSKLRENILTYPKKQSQWLHTSLGRILEPLDKARMAPLLRDMENNWGKVIGEVTVNTLLWTWEKQWYMVDKEILETLKI
jgi:hypothetical protein